MWLTARMVPRRGNSQPGPWQQHARRKWRRDDRRMAAQLVDDTEAFLSGRLVERAEAHGELVPVWAWTNLLAHGSEEDLRAEIAMRLQGRDRAMRQWHEARSYLATDVLRQAEQYRSLEEVQEAVLMPLELDLAFSSEVVRWTPGRWAQAVERALTEQRPVSGPS
jgi:hypothetical protein